MARVLLIKSDAKNSYSFVPPPLGLAYLSSALKQRGNHDVSLMDMRLMRLGIEETAEAALKSNPDFVGISALSCEYRTAEKLARAIKARRPSIVTIFGGPHATTSPDDVISSEGFDYIVFNEGDESLPELINTLLNKGDTTQIKGIGFLKDSKPYRTEEREPIQDLDSLPYPDWDLLEIDRYYEKSKFNILLAENRYMPIFTSRGCAFKCTYCHNIFGKKVRLRSAESVFSEMKTLYDRYGVREFAVIDDLFNFDPKRAEAVCDMILESGMKVRLSFQSGLRGDLMNERLLKKMKAAGTYLICYGIETASPRLQKVIKKQVNLEKLEQTIIATNKEGILTIGFFMLGLPSETKQEIQQTVDFACKSKLNFASFMALQPFPGTEIYQQAKEMGFNVDFDPDQVDYFKPAYNMSEVSGDELCKIIKKANGRFLLNPRRMTNTIAKIPSKHKFFLMLGAYAKNAITAGTARQRTKRLPTFQNYEAAAPR